MSFLEERTLKGKLVALTPSQSHLMTLDDVEKFAKLHPNEKFTSSTIERVIDNTDAKAPLIELKKYFNSKLLDKELERIEAIERVMDLLAEHTLTEAQLDDMEKDILIIGEHKLIERTMRERINS